MKRSDKTRGTILDEAIYIASKTGFEALTIGKLASAVGMSKSGLFAHFNSKEQLQVDVLKAVAKKFADKVITPSLKAARGEPRIRAIAKNWLAWTNAKFMPGGCLFLTATVEFDDKPGPVRDFLVSNQNSGYTSLHKLPLLPLRKDNSGRNWTRNSLRTNSIPYINLITMHLVC
jgi:AcrR family transcriptional regulator